MRIRCCSLALLPLGGLLTLAGCTDSTAPRTTIAGRPNFVFILSDDEDVTDMQFMPIVQAELVAKGTSFRNYYVSEPLCCPSRSTILTGLYPHNHHVMLNTFDQGGGYQRFFDENDEAITFPLALQRAGYRTGLFGKYLNEYPADLPLSRVPPGWTKWFAAAYYAAYLGYRVDDDGEIVSYGRTTQDYQTDVLRDSALAWITTNARAGTPFLAYIAPYAPHDPAIPAARHATLFAGLLAPRTPNFNEADVSDKRAVVSRLPLLNAAQIDTIDELYRNRLRSLQAVDEMVGAIVARLDSLGVLDRTYIVFMSDNGFHLGQHRFVYGKFWGFEEDIRVPLIVRGPGVIAGQVRGEQTLNNDLAPTFAQLAGARLVSEPDGRSFAPLLFGTPTDPPRQAVLIESTAYVELNNTHFAYIEYGPNTTEFYDLDRDPYELQNIYDSLPALYRTGLHEWLDGLKRCRGAACYARENAAPLSFFVGQAQRTTP